MKKLLIFVGCWICSLTVTHAMELIDAGNPLADTQEDQQEVVQRLCPLITPVNLPYYASPYLKGRRYRLTDFKREEAVRTLSKDERVLKQSWVVQDYTFYIFPKNLLTTLNALFMRLKKDEKLQEACYTIRILRPRAQPENGQIYIKFQTSRHTQKVVRALHASLKNVTVPAHMAPLFARSLLPGLWYTQGNLREKATYRECFDQECIHFHNHFIGTEVKKNRYRLHLPQQQS